MPPKKSNTLTEAELRLMKILWRRGESAVNDLVSAMPEGEALAYNSVLTTIRILEQKGYVEHRQEGRAFVYRPCVAEHEASRSEVRHVISRFFGNSRERLLLSLLGDDEISPAELERLKEAIRSASPEDLRRGVDDAADRNLRRHAILSHSRASFTRCRTPSSPSPILRARWLSRLFGRARQSQSDSPSAYVSHRASLPRTALPFGAAAFAALVILPALPIALAFHVCPGSRPFFRLHTQHSPAVASIRRALESGHRPRLGRRIALSCPRSRGTFLPSARALEVCSPRRIRLRSGAFVTNPAQSRARSDLHDR